MSARLETSQGASMLSRVFWLVCLVGAVCLPLLGASVGAVLPGPLNSVGSLTLLSMMMVSAALAVSLYLLIGVTGMLSFGHGLYFALGAYISVLLSNMGLSFAVSGLVAVVGATAMSVVVNGLGLRAGTIGYSMITLAFAELMALCVHRGFFGSGGDTGVILRSAQVPEMFKGLTNTSRLYWMALGLLVLVYGIVWFMERRTKFGRVWNSIRENELRTESLGYDVYGYKLAAAVCASFLASICGVVYALVTGGVQPDIAQVLYSLGLVVMVILGGRGVIWGAMLGGLLYTYLNLRLPGIVGTGGESSLPAMLRIPLAQPGVFLGVSFVLVILLLPDGLASGLRRITRVFLSRARRESGKDSGEVSRQIG